MISLADSRDTGSFGKPQPITIAQSLFDEVYWSVSFGICLGTTSELTHWWIRGSSSATEPESIDGVEPRVLRESHWSVSFRKLFGHNQHVISLADSRNTDSIGGLAPITIARCWWHEVYW